MTTLMTLWLPILLSAVFVFVTSSVIHMVIQWHKADYKVLNDEAKVLDALRAAKVGPGEYMFPGCNSMKDMGSPEMQAKFAQGPVGSVIVRPGGSFNMGKSLGQWFLLCLFVSACVAWLTLQARLPGAPAGDIFKISFGAAFLGHALTHVDEAIWKGLPWGIVMRFTIDGLAYAAVTAGTFAWLWPASF